jgi:hypothetical protein
MRYFEKMMEAADMNRFSSLDQTITRVDHKDITEAFVKTYQMAGIVTAYMEYDDVSTK